MQKPHQLLFAVVCIIMQITSACNKEKTTPYQNVADITNVNSEVNTAPRSLGGVDQLVILPFKSATLTGRAFDQETPDRLQYEWKKIKGPDSYTIDNKNGLEAKLGNLGKGNYEFELTVTDLLGLTGKDTVVLQVAESSGEINLKNVPWEGYNCWGYGMQLIIRVPANLSFTTFVKATELTTWMRVIPESAYSYNSATNRFYYQERDNLLTISTDDERKTSDLKIVF